MSYIEILATIYVAVNTSYIISSTIRDKRIIDNKVEMNALQYTLTEYKELFKAMSIDINIKKEKIIELEKLLNERKN